MNFFFTVITFYREFIVVNGIQIFVTFVCVDIVCFTSINLQKKIIKNTVFKPKCFSGCALIYDIYELQQLISKMFVHYLKSYPLGLYVNYFFSSVNICME